MGEIIKGKKRLSSITSCIRKYSLICIGTFIFSLSISLLLDPNNIAPGGVTGIAIIVHYYIGLSTGVIALIINIPIMVLGVWKFGIKFLVSTITATCLSSMFIDVMAPIGAVSDDRILCAVAGGALIGLSLGLIFKAGATTGGTDVVARLLKFKFPHIETGTLFILVDSIIVAASAIAFHDIEAAMCAGICVFITGKVFDVVMYGAAGAKLVFVISDKEQEIAKRIMSELDSGVTYVNGIGAYTDSHKKIIMCALKKQLLPKAEDIIKEIDLNAFIIITSANEIVGEGYRSPLDERV